MPRHVVHLPVETGGYPLHIAFARLGQVWLTDDQISKAEFERGGVEPVNEHGGMGRVETVEIITALAHHDRQIAENDVIFPLTHSR